MLIGTTIGLPFVVQVTGTEETALVATASSGMARSRLVLPAVALLVLLAIGNAPSASAQGGTIQPVKRPVPTSEAWLDVDGHSLAAALHVPLQAFFGLHGTLLPILMCCFALPSLVQPRLQGQLSRWLPAP
jgi:hypothetical protein